MDLMHTLRAEEEQLLVQLRNARQALRAKPAAAAGAADDEHLTVGQKVADQVASTMGSWAFIIVQSTILLAWIILNLTAWIRHWDPYPFILLNLTLSFQAAYAAPFIMMSQNRQQDIDRKKAEVDYQVNIKAELEIELLHQKLDQLRETEVLALTNTVNELCDLLRAKGITPPTAAG